MWEAFHSHWYDMINSDFLRFSKIWSLISAFQGSMKHLETLGLQSCHESPICPFGSDITVLQNPPRRCTSREVYEYDRKKEQNPIFQATSDTVTGACYPKNCCRVLFAVWEGIKSTKNTLYTCSMSRWTMKSPALFFLWWKSPWLEAGDWRSRTHWGLIFLFFRFL